MKDHTTFEVRDVYVEVYMSPQMYSIRSFSLRVKPRLLGPLFKLPLSSRSRLLSTPPNPPPSSLSRADRIIARLPRYLQPYAQPLLAHPGSHLTSFLILHELTAVIPLFTFFTIFQITSWNPADLLPTEWVDSGYAMFKRYVEKRGLEKWVDARGVLDLASAWAAVKFLMPVRVLGSVWAAPWFARVAVLPVVKIFGRRG